MDEDNEGEVEMRVRRPPMRGGIGRRIENLKVACGKRPRT